MNKKLKKIIAIALAVSAVSAVAPANNNLLTTKVYASSENDDKLSELKLKTSGGSTIKLYEDEDRSDKVDNDKIDYGDTYYAKTSSNKVSISTSGVDKKYIRVFVDDGGSISSSTKGVKPNSDLKLKKGTNTIVVRVYDKVPSDNPRYKDDDHKLYDYELEVKCTSSSSSSSSDDYDDIYLDSLSVDGDSISLSKSKTKYTKTVSSSTDEVYIKAKPDDSDYDVTIDGSRVYDEDNWKKKVSLEKGKNEFEIEIEDGSDTRKYTLVIYRGENTATSDNILLETLQVGNKTLELKENKKEYNLKVDKDTDEITIKAEPKDSSYTVKIAGYELDNDDYKKNASLKKDVVNTFTVKVSDNNGKTQEYNVNIGRGDDVKGYPTENNTAANTNTNTNTGSTNTNTNKNVNMNKWVQVGSLWQYYDAAGNPVKNTFVGKYYVDSNGFMVSNCWKNINGKWYCFDGNGAMYTGWHYDNLYYKKWYYFYGDGSMAHDTYIGGWRLGSDGAWIH